MIPNFKQILFRGFFLLHGTKALRTLSHHYKWDNKKFLKGLKRRTTNSFCILRYHRVNNSEDPFAIEAVPTDLFARQMAYISNNFIVLTLDDILKCLQKGTLPLNSVAVTFDDGYHDNYTDALPILIKYRIPATIFLTTGCIGKKQVLWFDRVLNAFKETKKNSLTVNGFPGCLTWKTVEERAASANRILKWLREISDDDRETAIREILLSLGTKIDGLIQDEMLTWDQVREMQQQGIRFGSHTVTHPILSRCKEKRIMAELVDSKRVIEEETGQEVISFAYPSGREIDFTESTINLVKKAGYQSAVTILSGANEENADLFLLRRVAPYGKSASQFAFGLHYSMLKKPI